MAGDGLGPPEREEPGPTPETGPHHYITNTSTLQSTDKRHVTAASVDWTAVDLYVADTLHRVGMWPMAGSVEWRQLPDGDPVKLASLLDAARHWALRIQCHQEAMAEASRDVSGAADWSAIGRSIRHHNEFYAARPWLKRRGA